MATCPRVVAGVVAAGAGIAVGLASSVGLSYARDHLWRAPVSSGQAIARAPNQGLGVAFEFVDAGTTAAFESALFQAEQGVRRRLALRDDADRWRIYRSREPSSDGRVLYMLWFKGHGDLETEVLADLLPRRSAADAVLARWSEHIVLTLVPVSPPGR
jgi:hypothetical protein